MAAPKQWGYTRDDSFGPEMLVSWTDGDLIEILQKEIVERLLTVPEERTRVARWARAAHDTTKFKGKDWIAEPSDSLVESCKAVIRD